jgi:hypothetical protein
MMIGCRLSRYHFTSLTTWKRMQRDLDFWGNSVLPKQKESDLEVFIKARKFVCCSIDTCQTCQIQGQIQHFDPFRCVSMRFVLFAPVPWAFCPPTPQTWQCHLGEYGGIVSVPCCILLHLALFILGIGHIIAKSSTLVRWATELRPTVSSQIWDFFEQLTLGLFPNCRTLQGQKKDLNLQE